MRISLLVFLLLALGISSAQASGSYEFCVTRVSDASTERFHAEYDYGDIDPTKPVAQFLVQNRFKRASDTSVTVSDYDPNSCPGDTQVVTTNASAAQLQDLAQKLAAGDVAGAGVTVGEIEVGVTVKTLTTIGGAIVGAGQAVVHAACHFLGC